MPELRAIISSLVNKLYNGKLEDRLINHIPYHSVIDAIGGTEEFTQVALNAIDACALALQGSLIAVEKEYVFEKKENLIYPRLDIIREYQSQESNPWPHFNGGYLDYITDVRDKSYWRGYHFRAIRKGKTGALHYYMITKSSAAGFCHGNFIRLWLLEFPWKTEGAVRQVFENVLEMIFTHAFQTIWPSILEEYFGPSPENSYSNVGLNIIPPLMQGRELSPRVRGDFAKLLENSDDPEIREWPKVRAQQEMRPRVPKGHMTVL
ncbi:uncharacterized protein N7459_003713 [Penicillium hispanicum]|uniref:uncharacterized protein n=1 Tax=Penicillium hispanicum TaxID=1080232 RepID=UPI0025413A45|nr:uncharacterized protein N7459_003713 [Penicillium hispanicum]KAJ5587948.1 hypothetical protein N7459_003713 [Penicillium hispanicum]